MCKEFRGGAGRQGDAAEDSALVASEQINLCLDPAMTFCSLKWLYQAPANTGRSEFSLMVRGRAGRKDGKEQHTVGTQ